jgi:adenylate cyclase
MQWIFPTAVPGTPGTIDVLLADDNLIVREGVRALIERHADLRVVGVAADYDEVVEGAATRAPGPGDRHPDAAVVQPRGHRRGQGGPQAPPGTGVVILSQYDDPEYAVSLLAEGSAGYGYLLKDHIAEGNQLVDAIRAVATGGTALDPSIVEALVRPVTTNGGLTPAEEELLGMVAEGKPIKAIAAARLPPEAVDAEVEAVFVKLAEGVSAGTQGALQPPAAAPQGHRRPGGAGRDPLPLLPGRPGGEAAADGRHIGETERVEVTVLMSDIRSYSTIAEHADPSQLAGQLNTHRAAMNEAILGRTARSCSSSATR